jgi:hypothetical protein
VSLSLDRTRSVQSTYLLAIYDITYDVMFCPKVTVIDDHVTLPTAVTTKHMQTWAEYLQSWTDMRKWTNYRESMAPDPAQEHVPRAYEDTQCYESMTCLA